MKMNTEKKSEEKIEMKTLTSSMESLKKQGYTENFMVNEYGLHGLNSEKYYTPHEVKITDFHRFEGDSDPADGAILYAIETMDGIRGIISDAYGAYGDAQVVKFMSEVEEIMKKAAPTR